LCFIPRHCGVLDVRFLPRNLRALNLDFLFCRFSTILFLRKANKIMH
jgi:hypothetical protein